MDLQIPIIKIDSHDDLSGEIQEEINEDKILAKTYRGSPTIELTSPDREIMLKKKRRMQMDCKELISQNLKQQGSSMKINKFAKLPMRPKRSESLSEGMGLDEIDSKRSRIYKGNSMPQLNVSRRDTNNVDALVSPRIMRKFIRGNKQMSTNSFPRNDTAGTIEVSVLTKDKSPRPLSKIIPSWVTFDDERINVSGQKNTIIDQLSPNLLRRSRIKLDFKYTDDEILRPRSRSLTTLSEHYGRGQEEAAEALMKPSKHWKIARNYAKGTKLPEIVQLYCKKGIGSTEESQVKSTTKTSKKCYPRRESEELIRTRDVNDNTLYRNIKPVNNLEARLKAIEIKHGIVHDDLT